MSVLKPKVESFAVPDEPKELTLAEFWNELDYSPKDFNDHHLQVSKDDWNPKEDFGEYMNEISRSIFESFDFGEYYQLISSIV